LAPDEITIRRAYPDDRDALVRLAALDSRRLPPGELLVAEVHGEIRAAVSMDTGTAIADPFRPAAAIVRLLRMRAAQLERAAQPSRDAGAAVRPLKPRRQPTG
jgi:hypothetical protein